ncbi:hypothetical protein GOEFS_013_00040 [Gordonia effusa NBRC 100432]|uniref:Uncharacterized protein n=1 Tax=Gordonia effusa NBRC 100432 TaxID=1077974 RepID=H0QV89_9ACTN|nr:hypothetical protein GOEFS_013_00040 [Gordonia effusa NBRC 100432]
MRCDSKLFGVGGIVGAITPAVADSPIEDHLAAAAYADLDRRLRAGLVPMPDCPPHLLGGLPLVRRLGSDIGDGIEIVGYRDTSGSEGSHRLSVLADMKPRCAHNRRRTIADDLET